MQQHALKDLQRPLLQSRAFSIFTYPFLKNSWFGSDGETEMRFEDVVRKEKHTTNLVEAFVKRYS